MKIDLHGYSVQEATTAVMHALFQFNMDNFERKLTIITGHGEGIIKTIVLELLLKEKVRFEEGKGYFVVYK